MVEDRTRDLAKFNLAIDSKLRGCDVVALKVEDTAPNKPGEFLFTQRKTGCPPRESRVAFLECGGNGQLLYQKEPAPVGVQAIHGLVSCAEWTGVKLSVLLGQASIRRQNGFWPKAPMPLA